MATTRLPSAVLVTWSTDDADTDAAADADADADADRDTDEDHVNETPDNTRSKPRAAGAPVAATPPPGSAAGIGTDNDGFESADEDLEMKANARKCAKPFQPPLSAAAPSATAPSATAPSVAKPPAVAVSAPPQTGPARAAAPAAPAPAPRTSLAPPVLPRPSLLSPMTAHAARAPAARPLRPAARRDASGSGSDNDGDGIFPMMGSIQRAAQDRRADDRAADATGPRPRRKTPLAPGHSPLDWAALTRSGANLAGVARLRRIKPSELAAHRTRDDAWLALGGRVYNVTAYLPFHPGGQGQVMRGAGKDADALFAAVHPWVNVEALLAKCLVGYLVPEDYDEQLSRSAPSI